MSLPNGYHQLPPGTLAAVVTYLEMREPPALPVPPAGSPFALRRVTAASPAWYRDLFRRIGEPWLWFSRLLLSDEELTAILHHPQVDLFTLSVDGADHGILELDRRHPPEIELAFFGVTPENIGKGAGRFLMECALREAWSHRPSRFWLHTCTLDHPRALAFYQSFGFVPYRYAVEIFDDPRSCGILPASAAPLQPNLH